MMSGIAIRAAGLLTNASSLLTFNRLIISVRSLSEPVQVNSVTVSTSTDGQTWNVRVTRVTGRLTPVLAPPYVH